MRQADDYNYKQMMKHMTEQMKQILTMHLVKISAYDVGSQLQIGRSCK